SDVIKKEMVAKGVTYLDNFIQQDIYNYCRSTYGHCNLTSSQQSQILSDATAHVQATLHDPAIAGYYLLDASPGPIATLLQRLTSMVHSYQSQMSFARPTVCAFGITLAWQQNGWHNSFGQFDNAVSNYSPAGCDIPDLYAYGVGNENNQCIADTGTDWTGTMVLNGESVISHVKAGWQSRGWDPSTGFVISGHTFSNGSCQHDAYPTGSEVQTETQSFCANGAIASISFSYDNGSDRYQLYNDGGSGRGWQAGYQAGLAKC